MQLLIKDKLEHHDYLSWAAFHASTQPDSVDPIALIALLPLFSEKAATITMIKHDGCSKKDHQLRYSSNAT